MAAITKSAFVLALLFHQSYGYYYYEYYEQPTIVWLLQIRYAVVFVNGALLLIGALVLMMCRSKTRQNRVVGRIMDIHPNVQVVSTVQQNVVQQNVSQPGRHYPMIVPPQVETKMSNIPQMMPHGYPPTSQSGFDNFPTSSAPPAYDNDQYKLLKEVP